MQFFFGITHMSVFQITFQNALTVKMEYKQSSRLVMTASVWLVCAIFFSSFALRFFRLFVWCYLRPKIRKKAKWHKPATIKQFFKKNKNVKRLPTKTYEPRHEISNNVVCATSKGSDQPAHTRSLIRAFASRLNNLRLLSY